MRALYGRITTVAIFTTRIGRGSANVANDIAVNTLPRRSLAAFHAAETSVPSLFMRSETDKAKLQHFMVALGERVRGDGTIYLTGGATALLFAWRSSTIDVDLKADPEPPGFFDAIAAIKDDLDINVELASPDLFIPAVPGWRERSLFVARHGYVNFFHYDPVGQALSKLQRRHERDLHDVRSMLRDRLTTVDQLRTMFSAIEPLLVRYPAIDPGSFRTAVMEFCDEVEQRAPDDEQR